MLPRHEWNSFSVCCFTYFMYKNPRTHMSGQFFFYIKKSNVENVLSIAS
jgi:hypothetical protein